MWVRIKNNNQIPLKDNDGFMNVYYGTLSFIGSDS